VDDITSSGAAPESIFLPPKKYNKMATTVEDVPPQDTVPSAPEDAVMDESEEAKATRAVNQSPSS